MSTNNRPDCSKFRSTLFWDTSFEHIDFIAHKRYVINRIFERGTEEEILETIRFYGKDTILATIDFAATSPFAENIKQNLKAYLEYEA